MLFKARQSYNLLLSPPDTWDMGNISFALNFHHNASVSLGEKHFFLKLGAKTWFVFKMMSSHIYGERHHKFPKEILKEKGKGHGFLLPFVNQEKSISPLLFLAVKQHLAKMWKVFTFAYYFLILGKMVTKNKFPLQWITQMILYLTMASLVCPIADLFLLKPRHTVEGD